MTSTLSQTPQHWNKPRTWWAPADKVRAPLPSTPWQLQQQLHSSVLARRRKGIILYFTLFFTFTCSWHCPDANIKAKGLPFALASSQGTSADRDALSHHPVLCRQCFCERGRMQETALLYLGTSPYKENNSLYNYYYYIIYYIIIMELPKFCNTEQLWTQIWRCQCYLLLLYNSYSNTYSYLSVKIPKRHSILQHSYTDPDLGCKV